MKRRDFVTSVIVGGLATPVIGDQQRSSSSKEGQQGEGHGHHGDRDDRAANHAVSFGHWLPTPGTTPIDRFAADPNPRALNGHFQIPNKVKIEVGDTVSFLISGFHNLLIYGPGTQPSNIDRTNLLVSPVGTFPPLINDPRNRVYRGLDPRALPGLPPSPFPQIRNEDRVEVVGFNTRGRYLVICGVLPHFFDAATGEFIMFGYVDVDD